MSFLAGKNEESLLEELEKVEEKIKVEDGKLENLYFQKGMIFWRLKKINDAIDEFDSALDINPKYQKALNFRGFGSLFLKNYDEAVEYFNRALENDSYDSFSLEKRGCAYLGMKMYRKAFVDLNLAVQLNEKNASAYFNRGLIYEEIGYFKLSLEDYKKSVEIKNGNYKKGERCVERVQKLIGKNDEKLDSLAKEDLLDEKLELIELRVKVEKLKKFENELKEREKEIRLMKRKHSKVKDELAISHISRSMSVYQDVQVIDRLEKYQIPRKEIKIGRALGKTVKEAIWTLSRTVCAKEIKVTPISRTEIVKNLRKQFELVHRNVLRIYGLCEDKYDDTLLYMIMEKMDMSLDNYARGKKLTICDKLELMKQMMKGLHFLHENNYCHGNVKLRNFLISSNGGEMKISDFGLIKSKKLVSSKSRIELSGYWMAPEIVEDGKFSTQSDIYALAISFCEILFETEPYDGMDPNEVIQKVSDSKFRPNVKKLPVEIKKLIESMWSKESKRPSTKDLKLWFSRNKEKLKLKYKNKRIPM